MSSYIHLRGFLSIDEGLRLEQLTSSQQTSASIVLAARGHIDFITRGASIDYDVDKHWQALCEYSVRAPSIEVAINSLHRNLIDDTLVEFLYCHDDASRRGFQTQQ